MALTATIVILLVSFGAGYYVFRTRGDAGSDATYDAIATISSIAWLLTAVFLVLGGFYLIGGGMIVIFTWLALTKGAKTGERLRARLANQ